MKKDKFKEHQYEMDTHKLLTRFEDIMDCLSSHHIEYYQYSDFSRTILGGVFGELIVVDGRILKTRTNDSVYDVEKLCEYSIVEDDMIIIKHQHENLETNRKSQNQYYVLKEGAIEGEAVIVSAGDYYSSVPVISSSMATYFWSELNVIERALKKDFPEYWK